MMKMKQCFLSVTAGALAVSVGSFAQADFDLKITELWSGNDVGSNLTGDWIEITNMGQDAWIQGVDGDLYFEDESIDPANASLITGIARIEPGQSVIALEDDVVDEFLGVWGSAADGLTIGLHEGAGLGKGGDGAAIWVSVFAPTDPAAIADFATYPDTAGFAGESFDVLAQSFSGSLPGAITSVVVNDEGESAIATPGFVVPEPAVGALVAFPALLVARRRRSHANA